MPEYARKCRVAYDAERLSKVDFLRCVLRKAKENTRDRQVAEKWIRALVKLQKDPDDLIPVKEIRDDAGTGRGMWVWDERGANVIEKKHGFRRIRAKFLEAMKEALGIEAQVPVRSILELQGLGKEVWAGNDTQEYLDQERGNAVGDTLSIGTHVGSWGDGHYEANATHAGGVAITTVYDNANQRPVVRLTQREWDRLVARIEWRRKDRLG